MKKILFFLLVVLPILSFSQVEIISNDASKYYPNGTRISYLTLSDYPSEDRFLDFVNSNVAKDTRIIRFFLYKDGSSCFVESKEDFTDDMIIDAINEAYFSYSSQKGESLSPTSTKQSVRESSIGSNKQDFKVGDSDESITNFSGRSFKKSDYNGQYYRVGFKLEDTPNIENVKNASIVLKERGNFVEIVIVEDIHFEIHSMEPISADFVIEIFEEFGLKIEEEFVK
jgi:hypothetical protein